MLDDTRNEPMETVPSATVTQAVKEKRPVQKVLSTIGFPYHHLSEVLVIPQLLIAFGVPCTRDQLAGAMKLDPTNSTFLGKVNSARTFGLIETGDGRVKLTQVGHDAVSSDPATVRTALVKAFLTVPLYRKTYDEFKGRMLPTTHEGLENTFHTFGVSAKQTEKARQVFQRSAEYAGFFPNGRERLIEPVVAVQFGSATLSGSGSLVHDPKGDHVPEEKTGTGSDNPRKEPTKDPLIHGLLIRMPEAGTKWDYEKRAQWLKLFAQVLDMVYDAPANSDESATFIEVEIRRI
jgi:hypothetical protein